MDIKCLSLSIQYRTLRKRATLLAALIIKDGTRRVPTGQELKWDGAIAYCD